ncbi:MAG: hypothetical protein AAF368_05965, partial [Planctomycetota bacterium]
CIVWAGELDAAGGPRGGPAGRPGGVLGSDGSGPGGGEGSGASGGGAGHRGPGGDSAGAPFFSSDGGFAYGNLQSLIGGSGGGAAGSNRGGGGGGAVELGATQVVRVESTGVLNCRGGDAEDSAGGGSGGTLLLHAEAVEVEGEIDVRGGDGGDDFGFSFSSGGGGSGGRVLYDAVTASFGSSNLRLDGGDGGSGGPPPTGESGAPGESFQWPRELVDCNENGIPDAVDLFRQTSRDADLDGVPDECQTGSSFCSGLPSPPFDCMSCPCGNYGLSHFAGCLNSVGTSARLIAEGLPRVSLDTLRFELRDASPSTFAVLVSGAQRAPANAINPCFGLGSGVQSPVLNGLRCVVQSVLRHGTRAIDANGDVGVTTNGWGPPNGPTGGLIAANGFQPGQTRHFQIFYRDLPFGGCTETQNTTQGFTVTFEP